MSILSLKFRSKINWGLQIMVRELENKEAMLNLESNRNPQKQQYSTRSLVGEEAIPFL